MKASKGDNGRTLVEVSGVTRWSRDNARRGLCVAARRPPDGGRQFEKAMRELGLPKHSYNSAGALHVVIPASYSPVGAIAPSREAAMPRQRRSTEGVDSGVLITVPGMAALSCK